MPDPQQLESMLVQHLGVLDHITRVLCRQHGLRGADADDFAASVRLRLVERDYAVLARFRGESALATYLTTVVTMLLHDWRVRRDGRWRPSAAALHAGPAAVRLERLVYRDRLTFEQAAEIVQAREVPPPTLRQLVAMFRRLPQRSALRPEEVGTELLEQAYDDAGDAEERVTASEAKAARRLVDRALARALAGLSREDRALLYIRFWEGASVADAARALGLDQKPLYRRFERLLGELRAALAREGMDRAAILDVLGVEPEEGMPSAAGDVSPPENGGVRPSNDMRPRVQEGA